MCGGASVEGSGEREGATCDQPRSAQRNAAAHAPTSQDRPDTAARRGSELSQRPAQREILNRCVCVFWAVAAALRGQARAGRGGLWGERAVRRHASHARMGASAKDPDWERRSLRQRAAAAARCRRHRERLRKPDDAARTPAICAAARRIVREQRCGGRGRVLRCPRWSPSVHLGKPSMALHRRMFQERPSLPRPDMRDRCGAACLQPDRSSSPSRGGGDVDGGWRNTPSRSSPPLPASSSLLIRSHINRGRSSRRAGRAPDAGGEAPRFAPRARRGTLTIGKGRGSHLRECVVSAWRSSSNAD
eukprot:363060-Chlamydomonas_euryale.AAC.6